MGNTQTMEGLIVKDSKNRGTMIRDSDNPQYKSKLHRAKKIDYSNKYRKYGFRKKDYMKPMYKW